MLTALSVSSSTLSRTASRRRTVALRVQAIDGVVRGAAHFECELRRQQLAQKTRQLAARGARRRAIAHDAVAEGMRHERAEQHRRRTRPE